MQLARKYALVQIVLHWAGALLLFTLLSLGYIMTSLPRGAAGKAELVNLHKSLGLTAALLIAWRVVERVRRAVPAHDESLHGWEAALAGVTHRLLYVCMLVMPISGYLGSSFNKYGTRFWGLPLPRWGWVDESIRDIFYTIHGTTSFLLLGLAMLHVAAVAKHQWLDRQRCMQRMLPGGNE